MRSRTMTRFYRCFFINHTSREISEKWESLVWVSTFCKSFRFSKLAVFSLNIALSLHCLVLFFLWPWSFPSFFEWKLHQIQCKWSAVFPHFHLLFFFFVENGYLHIILCLFLHGPYLNLGHGSNFTFSYIFIHYATNSSIKSEEANEQHSFDIARLKSH